MEPIGKSYRSLVVAAAVLALGLVAGHTGPTFTNEPSRLIEFSNNTGAKIECSAAGDPAPNVAWILADGSPVTNIASLRQVHNDGTLVFPPFSAADFRQDIHAAIYRCTTSNTVGTIVSRDVQIRAVLLQPYQVHIYDVYAILGNTAVIKCHVPSFLLDYVHVTSWIRDAAFVIQTTADKEGKYVILPNGELHIRDVGTKDAMTNFRCQTHHRLTGETRLSTSAGRLFVNDPQGNVPPRILTSRATVHVRRGEVAILSCVAQGYPVPNTTWFLRGPDKELQLLQVGDRVMKKVDALIIRGARTSDSGKYVCVASNIVGAEQAETILTVTVPLSVRIEPSVLVAEIKKPAAFACMVAGSPVSAVTWMKDGKPVASQRYRSPTNEKLRIDSVSSDDRGMYQCFAQNDFEIQQATAELRLGDIIPEFIGVFEERFLQPGISFSLRCAARGVPLPQIHWLLDDLALPRSDRFNLDTYINRKGEMVSVLNVTHARAEDGGVYKCVAESKAGVVEHSSRISIYGRPAVRPMPKMSVVAGEDVRINCAMYGFPIESVTWEKDGDTIPLDLRRIMLSNGTLLIRSIQRSTDGGRYRCTVRNKQGHSGHGEVEVVVMVSPKITPFSFQDEFLREGSQARIMCALIEGDPPIKFQWLKDGRSVASSSLGIVVRSFDDFSSILTISKVTSHHRGNYTCVAENAAASASHTTPLKVNVPPRWTLEPRDTTVLLGRAAVIHCQAEGFPQPTMTWLKARGLELADQTDVLESGADYHIYQNGSLLVKHATDSQRGYYFCQATNGIGNGLSRGVFLQVHVPVHIETKMQSFTVPENDHVKARCEARGDHPIDFTWSTDGQPIVSGKHARYYFKDYVTQTGAVSELTVTNAQKMDTRIFVCTARNPFGEDIANVQVIVQGVPDAPKLIKLSEVGNRSLELSWKPPYDGNSRITKYIVQYKLSQEDWTDGVTNLSIAGGQSSVVIRGLVPSNVYEFRMFAENSVGLSAVSDVISITMEDEAPGGQPQKVEVEPTDPQTLRVTWKPPPKELWNGAIRGYYVGYRISGSEEDYTWQTLEVPDEYMEELTFRIPDLHKFTQYDVIVQAYNDKGKGPASKEVIVMTSEDVPSKPPQGLRCTVASSTSLHVSWQPPPPSAVNGILRGYRVLYKPVEEWFDRGKADSFRTTATAITLEGLEKSINYSIQVLAFTKMGDGVKSDPQFCKTKEDIPAPPAEIKVLPVSSESILVVWKPPKHPNGFITRYTVYSREIENETILRPETHFSREPMQRTSNHNYPTKHAIRGDAKQYEVKGLKKNHRYEFWVTATTSVGEGQSTAIISQTLTGPSGSPKLASFNDTFTIPWKRDISLTCDGVGHPPPLRDWTFKGEPVQTNARVTFTPNGSLSIKDVQTADSGNYTCRLYNKHGDDQVQYALMILVPPSVPTVRVLSTTLTTVELQWSAETHEKSPLQGYLLHFKPENGQWKLLEVEGDHETYRVENLLCGTKYQMYVEAFNKIGVSEASNILTAFTEGSVPDKPTRERLVGEGASFIAFNLDAWSTNGCPILYFVVEYKQKQNNEWSVATRSIKPDQRKFVVEDLQSQTWYDVRIVAYTHAGSTTAQYTVGTLTPSGATMSPDVLHADVKGILFYLDIRIIITVIVVLIVLLLLLTLLCIILNKKRAEDKRNKVKQPLDMKNPNAAIHVPPGKDFNSTTLKCSDQLSWRYSATPTKVGLGSQEDLAPYTTYQLPNFHYGELKTFGGHRKSGQDSGSGGSGDESYWKEKKSISEQSLKEKPAVENAVNQNQVVGDPSYRTWNSGAANKTAVISETSTLPKRTDTSSNRIDPSKLEDTGTYIVKAKQSPTRLVSGSTEETTFIFPSPPNLNGTAPAIQGALHGDRYDRMAPSRNGSTLRKQQSPDESTRLLK